MGGLVPGGQRRQRRSVEQLLDPVHLRRDPPSTSPASGTDRWSVAMARAIIEPQLWPSTTHGSPVSRGTVSRASAWTCSVSATTTRAASSPASAHAPDPIAVRPCPAWSSDDDHEAGVEQGRGEVEVAARVLAEAVHDLDDRGRRADGLVDPGLDGVPAVRRGERDLLQGHGDRLPPSTRRRRRRHPRTVAVRPDVDPGRVPR